MDLKNEFEKKTLKKGVDFDILQRDEVFWQRSVMSLAKEHISDLKEEILENRLFDIVFWQRSVMSLAKEHISDLKEEILENENKLQIKHSEKTFCIYCNCSKCLTFRKLIIGIHMENEAYNDLWEKLKEIINSYYTIMPVEHESTFIRKHLELQTESCKTRWFSDGSIDVKKNIHVSMGNYFSLSNEMTFIIVFNMLYTRDRHQLFELLCLQLKSIIITYREGIKEITKCTVAEEKYYKPEKFLNYILDGYNRLMEISDTLTPLVIEIRDHLQKFSLTWQLLNQCMYYRFLYVDIESQMADCILKLKDSVDTETYKSFVYRFIKFDEEMSQIAQSWEEALVALKLYKKSTPDQVARLERIDMIRKIMENLCQLNEIPCDATVNEQALALDWIVSSEKIDVWLGVLNTIKRAPHYKWKKRSCQCCSCFMTGEDTSYIADLSNRNQDKTRENLLNDECYHLAWCVFKNLKEREPYNKEMILPEIFCVFDDPPCQRMECQVATNLIIGSYPLSFTKFLLNTYQPLSTPDREKFLKVPSQSLIRKFCLKKSGAAAKEIMQEADEINHSFLLLNMFWEDEDIADPILRAGLAAALAENFKIDLKFPPKHIIFSYLFALFEKGDDGDIQMDLEWLEKINLTSLFKSFGIISNRIHHEGPVLSNSNEDTIDMTLKELRITAEVSSGRENNALEMVQESMREVAEKLNTFSLNHDNNTDNAKKVLENEIQKPLVEALKLAANNKKLEAELKSLQKEHNMLKDMVKGLEQIHGEKKEVQVTVTTSKISESNTTICHGHSQPDSSSPSLNFDLDHGKDSGNGADCVCYYCTLFGKNQEFINSRSTETRDRLRKRLHQLQNQKDFTTKNKNIKNISLLLKNGATKSSISDLASTSTHASAPLPMNSTKVAADATSMQKFLKNDNLKANVGERMKMKMELELQQKKKKLKSTPQKANFSIKPEEVKIQRATEINVKSLENLVEYIEGPSSKAVVELKKAEEAAMKKQQKKAKQLEQKMRRQIDCKLENIMEMNNELLDVILEEKQVKNQLSQLKAGNKLNSNFDIMKECGEMKAIIALLLPNEKVALKSVQQQKSISKPCANAKIENYQKIKEDVEDPAKRMVTIRRINLPHAEPQVTVTAKGSNDMDQLLYTFVNGQLVPASRLSPSAFQNGSIQLFMSTNGQTKMVMDHQNLCKPNNIMATTEIMTPRVTSKSKELNKGIKMKQSTEASEKGVEKVKKDLKKNVKKKNETQEPRKKSLKNQKTKTDKKETATNNQADIDVNLNRKRNKNYIDPEFSANPFKLLDNEQQSESEEDSLSQVSNNVFEGNKITGDTQSLQQGEKKSNIEKKMKKKQNSMKVEKETQKKSMKTTDGITLNSNEAIVLKDMKQSLKKNKNHIDDKDDLLMKSKLSILQHQQKHQINSNSIMDQLNRGVRVEGLRLPPGITLTKVAPNDSMASKRDSINKIVQPIQDYSKSVGAIPEQSNDIIMIESNPILLNSSSQSAIPSDNSSGKKKNKKKKNKMCPESSEQNDNKSSKHQMITTSDRMVTLKNPLFYKSPVGDSTKGIMENPQPVPITKQSNESESQAASIIRNENGMYTIRNPCFQNVFGSVNSTAFVPRPLDGSTKPFALSPNQYSTYSNDVQFTAESQPKCSSVIGSEMKDVLQRRKYEQKHAGNMDNFNHQYGVRPQSTYSHFGTTPLSFNNNGTDCDDKFNSESRNFQTNPSALSTNYDELRLKPGHMLNSEVTIHNISESKMFLNEMRKTSPSSLEIIGNGNIENVGKLFGDLYISRPVESNEIIDNGNDNSIFTNNDNRLNNQRKSNINTRKDNDFEVFQRYNFSPTSHSIKSNQMDMESAQEYDMKQNSTNSNSPISVVSLDDIFDHSDMKNGNVSNQKTAFYPSHPNFNDDKSSGVSSLFSSGI
ncbi:CLUMA_CG020978, isoform A [Clunio marinus]|uniref:CLUMA_CG020978, isoform A n=1 Tax=Clunio marinus TaxID=568069 RepID=A0A1J1J6L8_9DIPT|nr:CLUMA_CG020978, isoform A [Clunio marinus]